MFLILTKAQADVVRGETEPGYALMPVECQDGTFALPDRVLTDEHHAAKWAVLGALPRVASITPKVVVE